MENCFLRRAVRASARQLMCVIIADVGVPSKSDVRRPNTGHFQADIVCSGGFCTSKIFIVLGASKAFGCSVSSV